ncbi:MAG TPA: DNA repair protein RecO [Acidimicrobiales bacterium]|nr:DNA repair protein RecO [Acidimicrobiales bacterium]
MGLYRDQGVVLRTIRLGEADRIVTVLTRGRGKVRAVAKGVRKTKSRFGGRLEPLSHVALLLYEGRELDVVTQVEALEQFRSVREDLDRLAKGHALLEAADQVAQEHQANVALYTMLVGALRALAAHDSPLLVPAFFLKVLASEGAHPLLDVCAGCGGREPGVAFDLHEGGVLCAACAGRLAALAVSRAALDLVRRVLTGDLIGALNTPAGPATAEVDRLATRAMEHHLERRLRSVTVLDRS